MYDCEADDIDELSFKTGDIIVVVEEIDDSWWVSSDLKSKMSCITHVPLSSPHSYRIATTCDIGLGMMIF